MDKKLAENIVTEYLKPVFGFALKRCKSIEDAEDLSQEIVLRAFKALIVRDDICDVQRFIWAIAHNTLANYYRSAAKSIVGISVDEAAELIADPSAEITVDGEDDTPERIRSEIAYLSKLQRKIVIAYYFENRRQAQIAEMLGIPVGTVKWHLFEAKKELKRGIDKMREASDLKFNPIKFSERWISGSMGSKSLDEFFRSTLAQNICYAVRDTAKTVNEIADDLGVSPVYVETEAEFLEEYSFLTEEKGKYLTSFIIHEPTSELLCVENDVYKRAAELFANDLYDELISSGILDDENIVSGQTDGDITLTSECPRDYNFLLWSLIPFITAKSGESLIDEKIKFEEVSTIRPDGSNNIFTAVVNPDDLIYPEDYVYMKNWCGPMWNGIESGRMLWQCNSEWSDRTSQNLGYGERASRVLSLYERGLEDSLPKGECVWLAEQGYVKICGEPDGEFKASWQIVVLTNKEIQEKLIAIGDRIKEKYKDEFERIKAPYIDLELDCVQPHMRKAKEFMLQFVFSSDGMFILHCIKHLLKNGKLKEPTEEQRKALTTMIAYC